VVGQRILRLGDGPAVPKPVVDKVDQVVSGMVNIR